MPCFKSTFLMLSLPNGLSSWTISAAVIGGISGGRQATVRCPESLRVLAPLPALQPRVRVDGAAPQAEVALVLGVEPALYDRVAVGDLAVFRAGQPQPVPRQVVVQVVLVQVHGGA